MDGQRAVLRALTARLADGDVGYFQRTQMGCLRAAVATVLQLPYRKVPELPDVAATARWGRQMGLAVDLHNHPASWKRRWVALSPPYEGGARHTLVMAYDRLYFDPASGWEFEGGRHAPPVAQLEYGLTLEPSC